MTEEPSVAAIREGLSSDDPESRRETIRSAEEARSPSLADEDSRRT